MSHKIVLCIVCLLCVWPVNGGFFDGMNVGLTIPAMSIKVPAPGMPKIKVNADIKMPPKQSLKSMLPKFKYNIPTFVDDYYPPYSPPMEYAASSDQQSIAPFQSNSKRPMRGNQQHQFKGLASDLRPHPANDQRSNRRPKAGHRPSEPNHSVAYQNGFQSGRQLNDQRASGNRQLPNVRPFAGQPLNNFQQSPGESRFRESRANFEPPRHNGQQARGMRPAAMRN